MRQHKMPQKSWVCGCCRWHLPEEEGRMLVVSTHSLGGRGDLVSGAQCLLWGGSAGSPSSQA